MSLTVYEVFQNGEHNKRTAKSLFQIAIGIEQLDNYRIAKELTIGDMTCKVEE